MRDKIKLESTAGTGHFYTTTKNKRTQPEKMEIKKFDPVAASTFPTRKPRSSDPGRAAPAAAVHHPICKNRPRASRWPVFCCLPNN